MNQKKIFELNDNSSYTISSYAEFTVVHFALTPTTAYVAFHFPPTFPENISGPYTYTIP